MSNQEYLFWCARSESDYAADKIAANGLTQAEAEEISKSSFTTLLPDGLPSKDNFLFSVWKDSERIVGYLWFAIRGVQDNRKAFIYDLVIEKEFRGQGFGRQTMILLEAEVRLRGLKHIGLHVFGFNDRAIGLYKSLGYGVTDLVMEKALSD